MKLRAMKNPIIIWVSLSHEQPMLKADKNEIIMNDHGDIYRASFLSLSLFGILLTEAF
jgi:hypothetical protein